MTGGLRTGPLCRLASLPPALVVSALLSQAFPALAHVIDVTAAERSTTVVEMLIGQSEIRVELETGVPDLVAFQDLFPDEFRVRMGLDPEPLEPRLRRFFARELMIRADDGPPLEGRVISFETRRRTPLGEPAGVPGPDSRAGGQPAVLVVLAYELEGRPESLTIERPAGKGVAPVANIGFVAYHLGLPVTELRPLGTEVVLDLNWQDPESSGVRDGDPGRTPDSPTRVFLHVEPFEVRVEILVRPVDLQPSTDVGIGGLAVIPAEIQGDVAQRAADCLADSFDLAIDGRAVRPDLDRAEFVDWTLLDGAATDPPRELDVRAATLGVVFRRPVPDHPGEVTLTWKLFSDRIDRVTGAVVDEAGPLRVSLHGGDNVLCWARVPAIGNPVARVEIERPPSAAVKLMMWASWVGLAVVGLLLIRLGARTAGGSGSWSRVLIVAVVVAGLGAGSRVVTRMVHLSDVRARAIASRLLHNVYRAFDGRSEESIHDALRESATAGPANEIDLATRRRLAPAGRDSARSRVDAVDVLEVNVERGEPGFTARCVWDVDVSAGHWGHVHRRTDRFVADLVIEPVDGRWRISAIKGRF